MSPQQEADCLKFDFDADSKGDSDCLVLSTRMVTAAKDYPAGTCFPCAGPIARGERHRAERGVMDGRASTCRTCAICCAAMAAYRRDEFDAIERRYSIGRKWHEENRRQQASNGGAPR